MGWTLGFMGGLLRGAPAAIAVGALLACTGVKEGVPDSGSTGNAASPDIVLLEMHPCSPATLLKNLAAYEAHSLDGMFLRTASSAYVFTHKANLESDFSADLANLQQLRTSRLKSNILLFRASGDAGWDWFSDGDWAATEANVRIHARLAKQGGLKALALDPENYNTKGLNIWQYSLQPSAATKDLAAMRAQVRKRGAQFMAAVQEECPGLPVMGLGLASFAANLAGLSDANRAAQWPTHGYGLLPAFTEGMASACGTALLIDGVEFTYDYVTPAQFAGLAAKAGQDVLALMDDAASKAAYQRQVRVAPAVYVDGIMNLISYATGDYHYFGWWLDTEAQRLTILENNIYQGCRTGRPFCWVYSEQLDWVTGANLPAGIDAALLRCKTRIQLGQALGFEAEVQALWNLVEGRKRAATQVKVM